MDKKEFLAYIKDHLEEIYCNFDRAFEISINKFIVLIKNITKSFNYNPKLNKKNIPNDIFTLDSILDVKIYLQEYGLLDEEIEKVIIKSPIILFYAKELEKVHCIFKKDKYIGYVIVEDDGEYDTYLYNENIESNIVSNNYITDNIIGYMKSINDGIFDFSECEDNYKLKNYYFKIKNYKNDENDKKGK